MLNITQMSNRPLPTIELFNSDFEEEPIWSIVPHGNGEALMFGRTQSRHGLNLVNLHDPATQWNAVKHEIVKLLNENNITPK